jgi:hypothetical protein
LLTRLSAEAVQSSDLIEAHARAVQSHLQAEYLQVVWVHRQTLMGPYDYIDIFRVPDGVDADAVAELLRDLNRAESEM